MSLINKTLQNLDKNRQSQLNDGKTENLLSGTKVAVPLGPPSSGNKILANFLILFLIVVFIVLGIMGVKFYLYKKAEAHKPIVGQVTVSKVTLTKTPILTNVSPENISKIPEKLAVAPVVKSEPVVSKTTASSMQKVVVPLTPEQQIEADYQEALTLLTDNKPRAAIAKLQSVLARAPTNIEARLTLASIFLKAGKLSHASNVIMAGLIRDPNNIKLIEFQANVLTRQYKTKQALTILQQHNPPIVKYPSYYALMALLYQRDAQYMLAARVYNSLAQLDSSNPVWWIGLGVSLESAGENNAARDAFQRALQYGSNLNVSARTYLENKIKQL
ncbi:MAG: tetratricopeptide repeat protein [Gammaproteobacteria bacterium]|nr:tetratricopeptide repeat protein [Gammaproteobacteria bacterium]